MFAIMVATSCASTPGGVKTLPSTASTPLATAGLVTPTTFQQACQLEPSVCSNATGAIPSALERPLHLPVIGPGQGCPTTPGAVIKTNAFTGMALGSGPVRPLGPFGASGTVRVSTAQDYIGGWYTFKTLWFSEPSYSGPFTIRGGQIDRAGPVAFGETLSLLELVVPPNYTVNSSEGYREAPGGTYVKAPGCFAYQVDGLTFSLVLVFRVVRIA